MQKINSRFSNCLLLTLLFVQGCSVKNSDHAEISTPIESISELAKNTELPPPVTTIKPATINQEVKNNFSQTKDSWQYLISLFAFPEVKDELIEKQLNWYLAHPEYIATIQTRAEPYLYSIIKQVEEKGLPGELALLPAVESGFKAHVYSRASAAGLWQFIPSTGKLYGLDQNWWYDGRRDVYASTNAATAYLQEMGKFYNNDWLLALASYNAGMGAVNRAIKRNKAKNKATDFWSLDLPRETTNYVPKLVALAKIFAHADQYGIHLKTQLHQPTFIAVNIGSQLELTKAAQLSNTSIEELIHLNPCFKRGYTPPKGPHRLLIPIANAELFKKNLAALPFDQRLDWQRHKVQTGENLGTIARRYQTHVAAIREVNQLTNNKIQTGTHILIPSARLKPGQQPPPALRKLASSGATTHYKVKAGDSLWSIARKFNLHSKEIAQWNKIRLNSTLSLGQTLKIKHNNAFDSLHYTVRNGDSLYAISEKF